MGRTVVAAALLVLLAGCASGGTPMNTPTPEETTSQGPTSTAPADVPQARWTAILADLDARGVATDDVRLVSARSVTWNNSALGCPKPGQNYLQALVDGMQVVVSVKDTRYDYRFGRTDTPKLCQGKQ